MEGRRRHPHELIGPHCDVYSLGKSIKNATDLLDIHHLNLKNSRDTTHNRSGPVPTPKLDLVYSPELWNLMNRCQSEDARHRPKLHFLFAETKIRMEKFRALARAEEIGASGKGIPGCFHSNVLFKRVDRKRFETDPVFRSNYTKANLRPVWETLGPPPSQNGARARPSIPLGEDEFMKVDPAHGAHVNFRVGQHRGGLPVNSEKRMEKQRKGKRKGVARVQQGIRGLLSRMNFFS